MPVPSPRNKILPARGNFADLSTNVASLLDGEICYAVDQDQYYQNEGGTLVSVGANKAQGALADTAVQPGDNVSDLTNDANYIAEAPQDGTQYARNNGAWEAVAAAELADGSVTPAKLSTGGPSWDTSGNLEVQGANIYKLGNSGIGFGGNTLFGVDTTGAITSGVNLGSASTPFGSATFAGQIDITGQGGFTGYGWAFANNGGLSNKTPSGPTVTIANDGTASFSTITADATGGQVTSEYNLVTKTRSASLGLFLGSTNANDAQVSNSAASITNEGSGYFKLGVNIGEASTNTTGQLAFIANTGWGPRIQQSPTSINALGIFTNNYEHFRFTSTGAFQVQSASSIDTLYLSSPDLPGTSISLIRGLYQANNGPGSGTDCFFVFNNGDVRNVNNSYAAISDKTLKENIVPAVSQWDNVRDIEIVNYNFKEETNYPTHKQIGVIAQQVEEVSPGLVDTNEDGLKAVNYSVLNVKAIKALQEAMARIETLEAEVAALKQA